MTANGSATSGGGDRVGPRRVLHIGTGLTGREVLRGIIEDPALELVGVQVSSPDKVGQDAGSLCGLPDVGVGAVADAEGLLDGVECVAYCATAVGRADEAISDMARFLRAGILSLIHI